ncbi:hypothetical protein CHU98_g2216 [Xylaria longipes]|nr:hypothetical protein CHU98_g2216 [Xylaria longipes]
MALDPALYEPAAANEVIQRPSSDHNECQSRPKYAMYMIARILVTSLTLEPGYEGTQHILKLEASKLTIAVRSTDKGEAARRALERSRLRLRSNRCLEHRPLQLFERQGAVAEDNERDLAVNVVSTFLLAFLLLLKMKETAARFDTQLRLTIVSLRTSSASRFRVNVSQFYAPYNGSGVAGPSDRQAFVSQTYDFSWSAEGNISEALDGATDPLCVTQLNAWADLPVNVTNGLTDGPSCVPALGQAYVDAILNKTPPPSREDGCKWGWGGYGIFDEIPECRGSFGRNGALFSTFGAGFSLGNTTNQINSGDTLWVNMSGPVLGNETWLYETVANQIQLLLFSVLLPTSTQPNASTTPGTELLYLRANSTKLPDVDVNKDGVAVVGEVVLLSAGTSTTAGVDSLMYLGLIALIVAVVLG